MRATYHKIIDLSGCDAVYGGNQSGDLGAGPSLYGQTTDRTPYPIVSVTCSGSECDAS